MAVTVPMMKSPDYYTKPSLKELVARELLEPGYCACVPDFTVGRFGFGYVRYLSQTDIRGLRIDEIVSFHRHEIVVYSDENRKPAVGQGFNKPAEVVLVLDSEILKSNQGKECVLVNKLKQTNQRQGAQFVSFDFVTGEWKFLVEHFSRFGFGDDDEEDIVMDDAEIYDVEKEESPSNASEVELSHSLPSHLRLDPVKMKEMKLLMFPDEEEEEDLSMKSSSGKQQYVRPLQSSAHAINHRFTPPVARKTPFPLLEYKHGDFDTNSPGGILMVQQHKGMPLRTIKSHGFKLDLKHETPVSGNYARNIVDAGLFMGKSFRVGWGPNGILAHSGAPVGSSGNHKVLSSVVNLEKVAFDNLVRDENKKVSKELIDHALVSPLNFHKGINHVMKEVEFGPYKLAFQKLEANRTTLSEISRHYCDLIEGQLSVSGLSSSSRLGLTHQVMTWEIIRVLFSDREQKAQVESLGADNEEDMMQDMKENSLDADQEALPLMRRAEFSYWLRESVSYHVQNQISSLNDSHYLQHIFVLLTGRQLDEAVQLAVSKGDVRLACLLSQAGGSTVNRSDIARQLDIWRNKGLDFSFIEKDRLRLYELLAGNIHGALHDVQIDWRRFLGLLMWYKLPPNTSLPIAFQTYKHFLDEGTAPYPVPLFIDEGTSNEAINWTDKHFDISFYLMLLHANEKVEFSFLKAMFSAFASTPDPLDYHMIWHQREVLEAVGVINSNDLHILDMAFVSQLLCLGKCHWAIYVVLHLPLREDYPYLHVNLIREILFQYCETWSLDESQQQFIEDLGIPTDWMHEALAIYYNYNGDHSKALEQFLQCANWQKAHTIFITSVAHRIFLQAKHAEIWSIATSMEDHKSEIENWDLGAGIYISFYLMRNSLQGDADAMTKLDSLQSKNAACQEFVSQLNESLAVWGSRLPVDARVVYSRMAGEICDLLLSAVDDDATRDEQLNCFDTAFGAPIPEDLRSGHLQDAVSLFTSFLTEIAT
ncbi:hypothetical protein Fmac_010418 [Flemingia macrophylla]|uniref:Peptidase S59 domain-containing protein n=1 Tax=Flemingia macrophylla TaxID=520843 RepID=A0ABD1MK98_9FABA